MNLLKEQVDYSPGCQLPLTEWLWLNRIGAFQDPLLRKYVSPFPPRKLMQNVSGLKNPKDFASHGADLYLAISQASIRALTDYKNILDFGCGCGRLARMFKGHPHHMSACDVDRRHIAWLQTNLGFVSASCTSVHPPLPYDTGAFDCVISISVFSHLNEASQDEFLQELRRISALGAHLFLSFHGKRALERAIAEPSIRKMIAVDKAPFQAAQEKFAGDEHAFILQRGHLTTKNRSWLKWFKVVIKEPFEYGISFIPEKYVRSRWTRWFNVIDYRSGAIHDFQDIAVLMPKK